MHDKIVMQEFDHSNTDLQAVGRIAARGPDRDTAGFDHLDRGNGRIALRLARGIELLIGEDRHALADTVNARDRGAVCCRLAAADCDRPDPSQRDSLAVDCPHLVRDAEIGGGRRGEARGRDGRRIRKRDFAREFVEALARVPASEPEIGLAGDDTRKAPRGIDGRDCARRARPARRDDAMLHADRLHSTRVGPRDRERADVARAARRVIDGIGDRLGADRARAIHADLVRAAVADDRASAGCNGAAGDRQRGLVDPAGVICEDIDEIAGRRHGEGRSVIDRDGRCRGCSRDIDKRDAYAIRRRAQSPQAQRPGTVTQLGSPIAVGCGDLADKSAVPGLESAGEIVNTPLRDPDDQIVSAAGDRSRMADIVIRRINRPPDFRAVQQDRGEAESRLIASRAVKRHLDGGRPRKRSLPFRREVI